MSDKMACKFEKIRKCFTFIWKVENAEYWWKRELHLVSPVFAVDEICKTKWKLLLYFDSSDIYYSSQVLLQRDDNEGVESVELDCELAFLSTDGIALDLYEVKNSVIRKNEGGLFVAFPSRYDVFFAKRSEYLSPQGTLTVRCRIWKSEGEFSKNVECIARTRIAVEKSSCLWNIKFFNDLESDDRKECEIKSIGSDEQLLAVELFISGGFICEETIRLKIKPNYLAIKTAALQVAVVDASKNTVKCFQDDFRINDHHDSKEFILFDSRREIMEKKNVYLPHNVLSLLFECSFCFGKLEEEIEFFSNCPEFKSNKTDERCMDTGNKLSDPKVDLINNFKSMLNNGKLSDVKLKTPSKTFPSHKCILSLRSPVFEAMFSNDMKENNNDCVEIEDLSDETVLDMLRYIYYADVEDLDWRRATELYRAADKYQILNLKDLCASYLKRNLRPSNACEALVLSDLHQDEDLKRFVQDFVLREGEKIINSEEWEKLMETHLKLAAETMRLKFQVFMK